MKVAVKRIDEEPAKTDGARILVDRLWPRGVSKARAKLDLWLKDIAPTGALRKWFAHDPEKWPGFQKKYRAELKENKAAVAEIRKIARRRNVTLLYAARDEERNEAAIIREFYRLAASERTAAASGTRSKRGPCACIIPALIS